MSENEYRVSNAGNAVSKSIMELLTKKNIHKDYYTFKSRVKSEEKLEEKVRRKLSAAKKEQQRQDELEALGQLPEDLPAPNHNYSLYDITDVVGLRIVTLFRQDMENAVKFILQLINNGDECVFSPGCIEEVIVFAVDHKFDKTVQKIKSAILESGVVDKSQVVTKESEGGYSSIHIVTRTGLDLQGDLPSNSVPAGYKVPIEIQIRTVFEDAWGEIDHKFGYQTREGKSQTEAVQNPEMVQKHLRILKQLTDACAQYADTIKEEATDTIVSTTSTEAVRDADHKDFAISLMNKAGVQAEYIQLFDQSRKLRNKAEKVKSESPSEADEMYSGSIQFLQNIRDEITTEDGFTLRRSPEVTGGSLLLHYVLLEEALCLLMTSHTNDISRAIVIYEHILDGNDKYPIVNLRLGQAYSKLGDYGLASTLYQKAWDILTTYDQSGEAEYFLPDHDRDYISKILPKLHGYVLWKESLTERTENVVKAGSLVARAYQCTKKGLSSTSQEDKIDIHNNLLYYAVDFSHLGGTFSNDQDSIPEGAVYEHLEELSPSIDVAHEENEFILDTLAYAYSIISETEKARECALRVNMLVLKKASPNKGLDDVATRILQRASSILYPEDE